MLVEKLQDSSIDNEQHLLSLQGDTSDTRDSTHTTLSYDVITSSPAVGNDYDAFYSSVNTFFSQISTVSDLTDADEAVIDRLRCELESLQRQVVSNGDDMPVTDLIKCIERLLKVKEGLVVEEDILKNSRRSTHHQRGSKGSSESSSLVSFEEESFDEPLPDAPIVHPMQNFVTVHDIQDSLPTPLIGNRKSLPVRATDLQLSELTPVTRNSRLPHTKSSEIERSEIQSPRPGTLKVRPTLCANNSLSTASDHGGFRPRESSSGGLPTRWDRSSNMKNLAKDSRSASDALKFNVKMDRANSKRMLYLEKMRMSATQH